jgi:AraC family transcriptional regulator of adaptative response/methylated-DNA-[protein]-cysteine methyltransferase
MNFETMTNDGRWQAVVSRDPSQDGAFVYAVRSTGIYCRPSCKARRPRPENVRFFDGPAAAERAGFRACLRCRPRSATTPQEELVSRATAWLDAHSDERATLMELAVTLGVSPGHLQRTFTRLIGVSPRAYAAAKRLEATKSNMRDGADVTTALHRAGYGSSSRFYDQSRDTLGMAPATYRNGGAGMSIAYATGDSPVGRVLVATTERGICSVSIGEDDETLASALAAEFPRATIRRDEAAGSLVSAVIDFLQDRKPLPAVTLDVAGTPFQRRVWSELQTIPAGERRTYGQIAEQLGSPGAARAVASACAANRAAVVIPCHRVVRADGQEGGYRWGAGRKRALLVSEQRKLSEVAPST